MAKYDVLLGDGRSVEVYAPDEEGAKAQANHQETTRIEMEAKRGHKITVSASSALSVKKIKD